MARSASPNLIAREVFLGSLVGGERHLGATVRAMARRMEDVRLDPGEALYHRGDPSRHFFFVLSGEMRLKGAGADVAAFGPRKLVGTVDAMLRRPHACDAVAELPSRLLRLRVEDWEELLDDDFELARRTLSRIASEVRALRSRPRPLGGFDPSPSVESLSSIRNLQVVDRILVLRAVPAFRRASTQALAVLARLGSTTFAGPGQTLFEPGETKDQLAVVGVGEVTASWLGSPLTATFGPGSLVGGGAVFSGEALGAVRAETLARVLVLSLEDYFDVMEEHFDLVESTVVALAEEREMLLGRGNQATGRE
jgi:CRP-like cAMP-binding protein